MIIDESVAFSPNNELLATGSWNNKARIIEVATGIVKYAITHGNLVWSVAFSPNGQYIFQRDQIMMREFMFVF